MVFFKYTEAERKKKEEAERRAKLDEIAAKQRQREQELEERERLRKEAILRGTPIDTPAKPSELPGPGSIAPAPAPAVAAGSGSSGGKYVPRFRRSEPPAQAPAQPTESDRWTTGKKDDRSVQTSDKWRPSFGSSSRFSR